MEQKTQTQVEKFALSTSRGFVDWLAASGGSIAFTTYQAGKVFLIGVNPDGKLYIFERSFANLEQILFNPGHIQQP